jgi:hypothetical protein
VAINNRATPPRVLYKYCRIHRSDFPGPAETLLTQKKVFFPSPKDFNDPFDCKFRPVVKASVIQRQRVARELVRDKAPHGFSRYERKQLAKLGSKLFTENLAATRFAENIYTSVGVLCFSALQDSILMWSHYAEMHAGICLEFLREGELSNALPISYSDEYPVVDLFKIEASLRRGGEEAAAAKKFVDLIYLSKATQWKYEDEWRLVDPKRNRGLHDFPIRLLSGIVFGCRTTKEDRERVLGWIERASIKTNLYQAKVSNSEYRLDICPM